MIRINLLPVREARRRADIQQQFVLLGLALAATLIGVAWAHFSVQNSVAEAKARVVQTEAEIAKFDEQLEQVEAYKQKKKEVQDKLDVIAGLERSRSGPAHMLDELAVHTPARMWLTKLEAQAGKVSIKGMSLDNEIVALFLTKLNESAYFANVELESTELKLVESLKLNTFRIRAALESPDGPITIAPAATPAPARGARRPAAAAH